MDIMVLKVRALVEDFAVNDFEVFTYSNSNVFTLQEPIINSITQVLYNGNALETGQGYTFNPANNKITIIGITFSDGDTIEVDYNFNTYSYANILSYITGALVWLSIFDYSSDTYLLVGTDSTAYIVPDLSDPKNKTGDLICIIASILILPNYIHYRMPNLAINYPEKMSREEKIKHFIQVFKQGIGVMDIIQWNRSPGL
jgi:hypothetical protein